jgi:hypothetical protein
MGRREHGVGGEGLQEGLSLLRLYVLRLMYVLNFALLGSDVWPAIVSHQKQWEPVPGVAYSFWGALSALSALGIRYPVAMLPLLFLQLVYKAVWLLAVARPLGFAGTAKEMTAVFAVGLVLDIIAIPWVYVFKRFVMGPGDRWK